MYNKFCLVCNDSKQFSTKVNEAKRIRMNISRILSKYGNINSLKKCENIQIIHSLSSDHKHQHFMCGYCAKVNQNELNYTEKELVDVVLKVVYLIENDKNKLNISDYNDILRLLSGHYPLMYRTLDREWHKKR